MANRIDTVVWDADNTLWDWISMHLSGMRAMSRKISQIIKIPEFKVKESMGRVYGRAGTFDYKPLVQEMDVMEDWARSITDEREKIRKVIDMAFTVHAAYTQARNDNFELYEGVEEVLSELTRNDVKNVIMSDAPCSKVIRRLKHFNIEKYFSAVYGQPEPMSEEELERGEADLSHYEGTRRESGIYTTTIPNVVTLYGERKPFIDFSEKFGRPKREVSDCTAVVGDNIEKDIGLACYNDCLGIHALHGVPDQALVNGLHEYGPPEVVTRNTDVKTIDNIRIAKEMRSKIREVNHFREIPGHILKAA